MSQTPTESSDYALLTAAYGVLLSGTAVSARRRAPIPPSELPLMAAATFALSKLIVHEKVESWVREPFVEDTGDRRRPKGRRLRFAVGELLTCTRCTGAWSALALTGLRLHAPATGRTVATVLATSAGQDFLHAAFSYVCARANTDETDASSRPGAAPPEAAAGPRAA